MDKFRLRPDERRLRDMQAMSARGGQEGHESLAVSIAQGLDEELQGRGWKCTHAGLLERAHAQARQIVQGGIEQTLQAMRASLDEARMWATNTGEWRISQEEVEKARQDAVIIEGKVLALETLLGYMRAPAGGGGHGVRAVETKEVWRNGSRT